jgi:hypothetical protein
MAEYELYCFAQSGNAYRAALMLNPLGHPGRPAQRLTFFPPPPAQKPTPRLTLLRFAIKC